MHRYLRPSPAMIVALIALSVALSGSAFAATKINGKILKNRSVPAGKIKKNSLTGKEIKESALSRVPRAAKADSATAAATATSAANAEKLGGIVPTGFAQGGGHVYNATVSTGVSTSNQPILAVPGIGTIQADCAANGLDATLEMVNQSGVSFLIIGSSVTSGGVALTPNSTTFSDGATLQLVARQTGTSTFQAWNQASGKTATFVVSNIFCGFTAHAATNQ